MEAGERLGLPAEGAGSVARLRLRAVAYVLDLALFLAGMSLSGDAAREIAGALVLLTNLVVLPTRWGTTVGHAAMRLRFVPVVDGEVLLDQRGLTVTTSLGRALDWVLCLPLTPFALLTIDDDRRTWVDRWTETVVLEW